MNLHSKYPTTPEEFLRWNEGREGKREFVKGEVVEMMINVTKNHWRLSNRLIRQLGNQLDDHAYDIGGADFGVRTSDGVRFPDVLVERAGGNGKELATDQPLLVVEVLSPSSTSDDFGPKARDYLLIESLQHYLVVSQTKFRVWLWRRAEDRTWQRPEQIDAKRFDIELDGRSVTINMTDLYEGVASPNHPT